MPLILGANSVSGGYEVDNSLRFDSASSDYLSRTFGSNGSLTTWTLSFWVKRSSLSVSQATFSSEVDSNNTDLMYFQSSDKFDWWEYTSGYNARKVTNQLFRDVSAWYHIVCVWDTTNVTSSDRQKIYVNGERITSFSSNTEPALNETSRFNSTVPFEIGRSSSGSSGYFGGYISEINFISGQALDPTYFGETDPATSSSGIWIPKAYTGSFGTNGFYLEFQNSASLGTDSSGNGNTFTVNNLTSVDQSTDTPTNNFCTLGGLVFSPKTTGGTYSDGNLTVEATSSDVSACGNFAVTTGKWYWETKIINDGANTRNIGITITNLAQNTTYGFYIGNPTSGTNTSGTIGYNGGNGNIYQKNVGGTQTTTSTSTTNATGDIIGIALDMTNGTITYYKNGTQLTNTPVSLDSLSEWQSWGVLPAYRIDQTSTKVSCNFGNPPYSANSYTDGAGYGNFSYAVPSGYYSLNTRNLANFG